MSIAELILEHFVGRRGVIAVADDNGFHPEEYDVKPEWLEREHLTGKRCLGFYVLDEESRTRTACVDFDDHEDAPNPGWKQQAEQLYYYLANLHLNPVVEISASGRGAHVWLFFDRPANAWVPRLFLKAAAESLGVALREVFPKQDRLKDGGLGNLIRYPLWNKSQFVDVENDWEDLDAEDVLSGVRPISEVDLKVLAFELGFGELKPEAATGEPRDGARISARVAARLKKTHTLLARRWNGDKSGLYDTSRSALVLSIACELVRLYIPTAEIEQALRAWCEEHNYDKGRREDWINTTVRKAYDFIVSRSEKRSHDSREMVHAALHFLETLDDAGQQCVPSGVADLDYSIDGVGFGEMCTVAARPSHGKSAFVLQWLHHAAKSGLPCLLISEEMSEIELGKRAMHYITKCEPDNWPAVVDKLKVEVCDFYADRAPMHIKEGCSTIERCEEVVDFYCSSEGVRAVAVDYMQLLGSRGNSRYEAVTDISRRLKQIASRNQCAMFSVSQLNRAVDSREGRVPRLSDLRESGQIEQDSDLVLFLEWPVKYDTSKDPSSYRIYVAKRRNGPIRQQVIDTTFNPDRQRVGDVRDMRNYAAAFEDLDG